MELHYSENCPDCGVVVGDRHIDGCDIEECTVCHEQRLGCRHRKHDKDAARWTGYWPGLKEAYDKGWASVMLVRRGWIACDPDAPGATADLNRWGHFQKTGIDKEPDEYLTKEQVEFLMDWGVPLGISANDLTGLDWMQLQDFLNGECLCDECRAQILQAQEPKPVRTAKLRRKAVR